MKGSCGHLEPQLATCLDLYQGVADPGRFTGAARENVP